MKHACTFLSPVTKEAQSVLTTLACPICDYDRKRKADGVKRKQRKQ